MWLKSPLHIAPLLKWKRRSIAGSLLILYRAMKVIWVKVKMALDINTGTLFESVRFPSTMEVQGGVSFTCLTACHKPSESISRPVC